VRTVVAESLADAMFECAADRAFDDFLTQTGDRAVDLRLRLFRVLTKELADRSNT